MIPILAKLALGWGLPSWASKLFAYAIPIIVVLAALGGTYALIRGGGEKAGAAKQVQKQDRAHAAAIADVRTDEHVAQASVDAIGARVLRVDDATTALVRQKLSEIHDAIEAVPPAAPGGDPVLFPAASVSASINGLIDRANGEAEAADAQP